MIWSKEAESQIGDRGYGFEATDWHLAKPWPGCLTARRISLGVPDHPITESRQFLGGSPAQPKKRSQRHRIGIKLDNYHAAGRLFLQGSAYVEVAAFTSLDHSLQLNVARYSPGLQNYVVAATIDFGAQNLKIVTTRTPEMLEQFADKQVLQHLFPRHRVRRVRIVCDVIGLQFFHDQLR